MLQLTVYRKAYNWRHATQKATIELLEDTHNQFHSVMQLRYVNSEHQDSVWTLQDVHELLEYWAKRRAFEKRPNVACLHVEHKEMSLSSNNYLVVPVVEISGTVDPVEPDLVKQTLVEFFTFLLLELHQPTVQVHYTFQGLPQPSLTLNNKQHILYK